MTNLKPLKEQHRIHTDEYGDHLTVTNQDGVTMRLEVAGFLPSKNAPHAVTLWRIRDREYSEPHNVSG